jgi:phosphoserine phosphatase
VIDQIKLARQHGAAGIAFFDLDYTLVNDILPYLRLGLFKSTTTATIKHPARNH